MSAAGEAKARSHLRERGAAKDRRSRPRAQVAVDTPTISHALNVDETARRRAIAPRPTLDRFAQCGPHKEVEG